MARNLYFNFKKGEVGKELNFTLEDANGTFDLTGWTVTLAVKKKASDTAATLTGQTVTNLDQTTSKGECKHVLNSTSANIDTGIYKACELKAVNGSNVLYWPCNKDNERTYFTIEVQQPVS